MDSALQSQQIEVPAGSITQGSSDFSVYFDALATRVQSLGDMVIAQTSSGPVYLRNVARVEDTFKTRSAIARVNGQEGIALVIVKLADANSITVVDSVKHKLDELNTHLPPETRLDLVVDSSNYTAKSFGTVQNALFEAIFGTGLILLLFLHTWRSTLIAGYSISYAGDGQRGSTALADLMRAMGVAAAGPAIGMDKNESGPGRCRDADPRRGPGQSRRLAHR